MEFVLCPRKKKEKSAPTLSVKTQNRRSPDITKFSCILILYGLTGKNLLDLKKCILDISWKLVRLDLYAAGCGCCCWCEPSAVVHCTLQVRAAASVQDAGRPVPGRGNRDPRPTAPLTRLLDRPGTSHQGPPGLRSPLNNCERKSSSSSSSSFICIKLKTRRTQTLHFNQH